MLQRVVPSAHYRAADFLRYATSHQRRELLALAQQLRGKRIVHVNATSLGGGVAEIMQSFVPYLHALGIRCDWYVLNPRKVPKPFFAFTNRLHNALQGIPVKFSSADWSRYRRINTLIGEDLVGLKADIVVVNDPQPLLSGTLLPTDVKKIYISHIDTSASYQPTWKRVLPFTKVYDAIVFSNQRFVHHSIQKKRLRIIPPAIDPLGLKQTIVSQKKAKSYLRRYGIPTGKPLVIQVSRFDVWKNPLGVIQAHHLVHQSRPDVHTIFVGLKEAKDNPEADHVYRDIVSVARAHQSIHLFFEPWGIKNIPEFTMMAQNAADIIVQNSIKEGFGLTVTEAMWKSKPVIGGPGSGIRKQIQSGKNGLIAKNPEELASDILNLLGNLKLRRRLGHAAHASVTKKYLMHRLVLDHLRLYSQVLRAQ